MVKYEDGLDVIARALAHRGRRQIVDRLRVGTATTTELATMLQIGLPAVTNHLALLGDAQVIRRTKLGRVVRNELDPRPLAQYSSWLETRQSFWQEQLTALDEAVR